MLDRDMFSQRLKELRQEHSLTLQSLAEMFSHKKAAFSHLETGKRSPSSDLLIAIADHFGVSLDYLTGRSDVREVNR